MVTATSQPSLRQISPKQYQKMARHPILIDVRTIFEYKTGHAPQAVNLSLFRLSFGMIPGLRRLLLPKWFRELPKDQPMAVICLTSHRSPIAAKQLIKAGFSRVYNITGGMMEWQKQGLPTTQ
ncbi:MAG: rhodanese-like domain-containing protein [Halothece sp.]